MANPLSLPNQDQVVDKNGLMSREYRDFLSELSQSVSQAPSRIQSVNLPVSSTTPVSDSIPTTAIPVPSVFGGLYRVTYYARITTIGSVSSSLSVTISWTDGGVNCSNTCPALTANTTSSTLTGTVLLSSDAASPINYATTYASNGANEMQYRLSVVLESIQTSGGA